MGKNFDKLDETFNVETEIVLQPQDIDSEITKIEEKEKPNNDVQKDYEYTRGNLYSLIEKGQEAINGILELAQERENII